MEEKTLLTILLPNSFRETTSTIHIDRARDSDGGVSLDTLGRMLYTCRNFQTGNVR